eukprot:CAMPEP_0113523178 /NCGR_PEP_ID=MMETSP0014_2-20120614/45572_1 /TAXON_ID=2857 /ORGANISM="Nitzschia sp." /LENGTH=682 /DNA_ID=CAMNT_0000421261 /DNA_START=195 /DNA_END=2243 /DNA_ORIENTATION=- /assembly_acc=CAM_ASM_000159
MPSLNSKQTQLVVAGVAATAVVGLLVYSTLKSKAVAKAPKKLDDDDDDDDLIFVDPSAPMEEGGTTKSVDVSATANKSVDFVDTASDSTPRKSNETGGPKPKKKSSVKSSSTKASGAVDEKQIHTQIEALDKKGKAFFKNKQFAEAAAAFTEALDVVSSYYGGEDGSIPPPSPSTSLNKQIVTLINNRSAMYEKGKLPELALEDCNKILDVYDATHQKARLRKLRVLESAEMKDYYAALVEVCALQLLYMQQNRDQLRMGIQPSTPPPVPQSKLEQLVQQLVPERLDEFAAKNDEEQKKNPRLPSDYTLIQLLKSYTGYNAWMAKAAKDGSVSLLKGELELLDATSTDPAAIADRASVYMKIGQRYVYDGDFASARDAILEAYSLIDGKSKVQDVMKDDDCARLFEWAGMVKHWTYDLDNSNACYRRCAEMEPLNAEIMVKQAGVAMDGMKHKEALELFDRALTVDPEAIDALLHRANLRMLQADLPAAKADLEKCVELRPDYVLAHLRLAAVLTSSEDADEAKKHLATAERVDPDSSEVQSYRGELYFTQQEFEKAKEQFEKAQKLEPKNPTPYVNGALAVLNTPPKPGQQMQMAQEACDLLEKAIKVDPQFQAAYVQLGQLKLGMATDLKSARNVVALYDKGLSYCRTKDEMKDLMGMKLLTQAQVDAASELKMDTFNLN